MASIEVADISMDTAYSKLEVMIRNYTREKLNLDNKIGTLQRDIEVYEQALKEKDGLIKNLQIEKDRYQEVHEEDEKTRFTLETMILSCEQKMKLLFESLNSLQCNVEFNHEKYSEVMAFNQAVKKRQLSLNDMLTRAKACNEESALKLEQSEKIVEDLKAICSQQRGEKQMLEKDWTERCNELQATYKKLEEARATDQRVHQDEMSKQLKNFNTKLEDLQKQNSQLVSEKEQLEEARKTDELAHQEEMANQLKNFNTKLEDIQKQNSKLVLEKEKLAADCGDWTERCNELQANYKKLEEARAADQRAHEDEMSKQLTNFNTKLEDLQKQNSTLVLEKEQLAADCGDWTERCNELQANYKKLEEARATDQRVHQDEMSKQLTNFNTKLEDLQKQNSTLVLGNEQLAADCGDWTERCNALQATHKKLEEARATDQRAHEDEMANQLTNFNTKLEDLQKQNSTLILEKEQLAADWGNKLTAAEVKYAEALNSIALNVQEVESMKLTVSDLSSAVEVTKLQLAESEEKVISLNEKIQEIIDEKNATESKLQGDLKIAKDSAQQHFLNGEKKNETIRSLNKRFEEMKKLVTPVVKSRKEKEAVIVAPVIPERSRTQSQSHKLSSSEESDGNASVSCTFAKDKDTGKSNSSDASTKKFNSTQIPTGAKTPPSTRRTRETPKRLGYSSGDLSEKKKVSFFGFSSQSSSSDEAELNSILAGKTNGILTTTPTKRRRSADEDKDFVPPRDKKQKKEDAKEKNMDGRKFFQRNRPPSSFGSTHRRSY